MFTAHLHSVHKIHNSNSFYTAVSLQLEAVLSYLEFAREVVFILGNNHVNFS